MAENFVVEVTDVERSSSGLGGSERIGSEPLDLALPDLVRECLSRDRNVPIDLDLGVGALKASGPHQFVDGALTVPPKRVNACIDDQPSGAPGLGVKHPEPLAFGAEETHLVGQSLRIQAPALDESAGTQICAQSAECGQTQVFGLEPNLEMMPGNGLVVDRRGAPAEQAARKIDRIHIEDPGPSSVRGRWQEITWRAAGDRTTERLDLARGARESTEQSRRGSLCPRYVRPEPSEQGVLRGRHVGQSAPSDRR